MPTDAALRVLHAAADGSTPDAKDVFEAIRAISKAKLPVDFASTIAGPGSTMRHWQLLFTANGNDLNAANAGKPSKVGNYWLTSVLPACLGYSQDGGHDNGVYLASGAVSLRFSGLYDLQSNKVGFDFGSVAIKLGPWSLPIVLKKQVPARYDNPASAPGLFVMIYADDKVVRRGRTCHDVSFFKSQHMSSVRRWWRGVRAAEWRCGHVPSRVGC